MFKLVSLERWDNWYVKLDGQEIGNVYKYCGSYQCFVCTPDDANAIVPGTFETPEAAARAVAETWIAQQSLNVQLAHAWVPGTCCKCGKKDGNVTSTSPDGAEEQVWLCSDCLFKRGEANTIFVSALQEAEGGTHEPTR